MTKTLAEIAAQLSSPRAVKKKRTAEVEQVTQVPKVQLIYAFNGSGKTRLSREFKQLISQKADEDSEELETLLPKVLYYNALTEDLFYWDNGLEQGAEPRLLIQPNAYTNWLLKLLKDLGQDGNITEYFQHYVNDKLTPLFSESFSEVTFSLERGDDKRLGNLKISKGEESSFIWSVFYALLDQAITMLNVVDVSERETDQFDHLEYVFIDDPVSSLDENHLIELAVSLAGLIKACESDLKFVITTHSPLFYNVLYNELKRKTCYLLQRFEDGSFALTEKQGDSNKSFSYHLYLKQVLEQAIAQDQIERYHFTLLRNLYEKTANFLGFPRWSELLPPPKQAYFNRVIQFTSHSTLSNEAVAEPTAPERQIVRQLLDHLQKEYRFWHQVEEDVAERVSEVVPTDPTRTVQAQGLKTPDAILLLLQENPRLTRHQIATTLGKHLRTIDRALAKLKQAGRLRRIVSGKAGHWEVQG